MQAEQDKATVKVWDPLVRIGHWTLVVAFFTAYLSGDEWLQGHVWAGYVVAGVVVLRILWGLVGSRHARFTDFARSPRTIMAYLRDLKQGRARHDLGHNPAGGAMIVLMLLCLSGVVVSGLMVYALEERAGPLAGWVSRAYTVEPAPVGVDAEHDDDDDHEDGHGDEHEDDAFEQAEDFWEETHELLSNLMLLLVILHVAAVVVSSRLHGENLVRAMLTGKKQRVDDSPVNGEQDA